MTTIRYLTLSTIWPTLPGHENRQRRQPSHRRRAPLQPFLHAPDRRAAQKLSRQPLLARRNARAVRTGAGQATSPPATSAAALDLDAGYLSRVLRKFERSGLVSRTTSKTDARQSHLALTAKGRKIYAPAEKRSQSDVAAMLGKLKPTANSSNWSTAMQTIETLLDGEAAPATAALIYLARAQTRRLRLDRRRARRRSMRANMAGTNRSKACARRSSPTSSRNTIRPASAAGSPRWTASRSARSCWSRTTKPGTARIRLLIVDPKARGLGLGNRLTRRMRQLRAPGRLQENHAVDAQRSDRRAPLLREGRLHADLERAEAHLGQGRRGGIWDMEL